MTGQEELQEKCLSFIMSNFDTVMEASDWPYMSLEEVTTFLALSDLVVSCEASLWYHVEKWLMHPHNKEDLEHNLRWV